MAVEDDRVVALSRNVEIEHRRAPLEAHDLELEPLDALARGPGVRERHRGLEVAVAFPVGIEIRRLRRQADVVDELRDDVVVPLACDAGIEHDDILKPNYRGTH